MKLPIFYTVSMYRKEGKCIPCHVGASVNLVVASLSLKSLQCSTVCLISLKKKNWFTWTKIIFRNKESVCYNFMWNKKKKQFQKNKFCVGL